MGFGSIFKAVTSIAKVSFFVNPIVALVTTLAIAWIFRPKTPEIPDFGDNLPR
jgi:uncharacterized membrane protein YtjA (UPF0391 family)